MSTHPIENNKPEPRAHKGATSKGLTFARYFTKPGRHPYDELTWEHRSAVINDERGQPVFEQQRPLGVVAAHPGRRRRFLGHLRSVHRCIEIGGNPKTQTTVSRRWRNVS